MLGPGSSQPGGGDIVEQLKNWWITCPLFTYGLVYVSGAIYVLTWFGIGALTVMYAYGIIPGFQLWRLFTSPLTHAGILQLLFAYLAWLPQSTRHEREHGTVRTCADFFIKNVEIYLAFIAFCWILAILFPLAAYIPCYGFWQIFFVYLVERCMSDPEGVSMLLCLPIQIKNKFYPIALLLLFSLIGGRLPFDNLVAMGVGYFNVKHVNAKYNEYMNSARMSAWENNVVFSWMKQLPNYVNTSGTMTNAVQVPSDSSSTSSSSGGSALQRNTPAPTTQAFSGKGITLGGSGGASANEPIPQGGRRNENYYQLNDDNTPDLEVGGSNTTEENK